MEDEEERVEALLRETLAYIEALDADIKAQAHGGVSATAFNDLGRRVSASGKKLSKRGDWMPDMDHNIFCNYGVAEALTQLIDDLPATTCVSIRREISLAEFRHF